MTFGRHAAKSFYSHVIDMASLAMAWHSRRLDDVLCARVARRYHCPNRLAHPVYDYSLQFAH